MQIQDYTDDSIKTYITTSHLFYTTLCSSKYTDLWNFKLWTTDFNILLFYELFLNTVFHQSLFTQKPTISVEDILNKCGIPPKSNLYGRILDIVNLDCPNSIDITDFQDLTNANFDQSRKKIIQ